MQVFIGFILGVVITVGAIFLIAYYTARSWDKEKFVEWERNNAEELYDKMNKDH